MVLPQTTIGRRPELTVVLEAEDGWGILPGHQGRIRLEVILPVGEEAGRAHQVKDGLNLVALVREGDLSQRGNDLSLDSYLFGHFAKGRLLKGLSLFHVSLGKEILSPGIVAKDGPIPQQDYATRLPYDHSLISSLTATEATTSTA